jgi:hypothetical protein
MNLQVLRSSVFEISKKATHTFSDVVALQLICMQVVMLLGNTETAKTKEINSFVQFLYKETRRVISKSKNLTRQDSVENSEGSADMEV